MLKQRVLTALLLLPLVTAAIFALPSPWFCVLIALILLGGTREYARLAALSTTVTAYLLVVSQAAIFVGIVAVRPAWEDAVTLYLAACCAAWLLMFTRLPFYRQGAAVDHTYRATSVITAVLSITTGWFAICWLHKQTGGSWLILLLLLIVWAADTGAYFAGKQFGKTKLAPAISPGKTRAGFAGGLLLAPLVAVLAAVLLPVGDIRFFDLVLLSVLTALVSVGGDLLISMHKRRSGHKDSGKLLPGHGGILDRVDSLLAAAPFFALGVAVSGL